MGSSGDNLEGFAREICERICRRTDMPEAEIPAWIERHWECATADIEAGVIDEAGNALPGGCWERGLEAYRDRLAARARIADGERG